MTVLRSSADAGRLLVVDTNDHAVLSGVVTTRLSAGGLAATAWYTADESVSLWVARHGEAGELVELPPAVIEDTSALAQAWRSLDDPTGSFLDAATLCSRYVGHTDEEPYEEVGTFAYVAREFRQTADAEWLTTYGAAFRARMVKAAYAASPGTRRRVALSLTRGFVDRLRDDVPHEVHAWLATMDTDEANDPPGPLPGALLNASFRALEAADQYGDALHNDPTEATEAALVAANRAYWAFSALHYLHSPESEIALLGVVHTRICALRHPDDYEGAFAEEDVAIRALATELSEGPGSEPD